MIRESVADLSWLLSRGYAVKSALKLVADRHSLTERQRLVVSRSACSDMALDHRLETCHPLSELKGRPLVVDALNLIITIEAALSGGLLAVGRDSCLRDLSSVHGSYRKVVETTGAIELIGAALHTFDPERVIWLLDKPVSNSGRLASLMKAIAHLHRWAWTVDLVASPDAAIAASGLIAITSDSAVLDRISAWVNFAAWFIPERIPGAWILDLRTEATAT